MSNHHALSGNVFLGYFFFVTATVLMSGGILLERFLPYRVYCPCAASIPADTQGMPAAEPAGQLAAPFIRPIVREAATEAPQLFVPRPNRWGLRILRCPTTLIRGQTPNKPLQAAPRGPHLQGLQLNGHPQVSPSLPRVAPIHLARPTADCPRDGRYSRRRPCSQPVPCDAESQGIHLVDTELYP